MIRRCCLVASLIACVLTQTYAADPIALNWDRATLRYLSDGVYPRMTRLKSGVILLSCDSGGKSIVRRSRDNGVTWSDPIIAATFDHGIAANGEILELDDGRVWLLYNERPNDGKHPFTIRLTESRDEGVTWTPRKDPLYVADTIEANGCWEPAGVQLAGGDILVFCANESPYCSSTEQEITLLRSRDRGATFLEPRQFSFRAGARDGMPVPLILRDGTFVVAIEDEALTRDRQLKPVILKPDFDAEGRFESIAGDDARRWGAVADPWADRVYAGAPFLRQLPTGQTLLSCQNNHKRREPEMIVYIGDEHARAFSNPSAPFALPSNVAGKWNSLFVRDETTIVALTSTSIDRRFGVWAITGHVVRVPTTRP